MRAAGVWRDVDSRMENGESGLSYRNLRVGIIGAGPAGLSLAKLLRQKGFTNIELLEAGDRAGGKARSVNLDGVEFNLGACYVTTGYGLVRRWLREYGITTQRQFKPVYVDQENRRVDYIPYLMRGTNPLSALWQCARYVWLWSKRYVQTEVWRETPAAVLDELAMPATRWFEKHRMPFLIKPCRRGYQVMGYGVLEEVPMLHVLRWVTPTLLMSGMLNFLFEVRNFESLFSKIAAQFTVHFNSRVTDIERGGDGGFDVVTSGGDAHHYDILVSACFLDEIGPALFELSAEAEKVASVLEYKRWVVQLARITGADGKVFYTDPIVNYPDAWENVSDGKIVGFRKSIFDVDGAGASEIRQNHYLAGQVYFDESGYHASEAAQLLEQEITRRGGRLDGVRASHVARYAPTYRSQAVREDVMKTMRSMQGEGGLYFTGSTFCHESVKNIVNFNRYLADRIDHDLDPARRPRRHRLKTMLKRLRPFNL